MKTMVLNRLIVCMTLVMIWDIASPVLDNVTTSNTHELLLYNVLTPPSVLQIDNATTPVSF